MVRQPESPPATNSEVATFGGGCFWCLEAVFQELRGVLGVTSGYAGGSVPNPTYEAVCIGRTGHAEVVQLRFDPSRLSYADLLRVFFSIHDPTTQDRQGADVGAQYRSIILTHSAEQERTARGVIQELTGARAFRRPIVTEVQPLTTFYPAEEYHQNYYRRNPGRGYCQLIISPKMAKFRKQFAERLIPA